MTGLEPSASERLPLLLAFDFSHAFPSVSHEWIFLVLSACSLPPPLLIFYRLIYSFVCCFSQAGSSLLPLFFLGSGIVQGCPASGTLCALASEPFHARFRLSILSKCRGIIRCCADDVGG
eukprot:4799995-Pyramimonas_sp.AAC.1